MRMHFVNHIQKVNCEMCLQTQLVIFQNGYFWGIDDPCMNLHVGSKLDTETSRYSHIWQELLLSANRKVIMEAYKT